MFYVITVLLNFFLSKSLEMYHSFHKNIKQHNMYY